MRLFWREFVSSYLRNLKFTKRWFQKFEHHIPENSYVLLKEKLAKGQRAAKPGRYLPGRVVGVHRRENGLITRLDLKTTEHKGIIQRDIRDCSMTEHDFLNIVEKDHSKSCLFQDTKLADNKTSVKVPLNVALNTHILRKIPDWPSKLPKRGQERVFSTCTFIPKEEKERNSRQLKFHYN